MRLIALITASFLMMGAECAWSQQPPQEQRPETSKADQAEPQADVAPETPTEQKEITEPHGPERADEQDGSANADLSWFNNFLRFQITDLVVVLATIAIAGFTYMLWRVTGRLADVGEAQSDTARILERAYIGVEPGGVQEWRTRSDLMTCNIVIKNVGRLPAREVRWTLEYKLSVRRHRTEFPIPVDAEVHGPIYIVPGINVNTATKTMQSSDFTEFTRGAGDQNRFVYVWGEVRYKDGFLAQDRWVRFCHRYNAAAMPPAERRTIAGSDGRYHEHGNSTDEDE